MLRRVDPFVTALVVLKIAPVGFLRIPYYACSVPLLRRGEDVEGSDVAWVGGEVAVDDDDVAVFDVQLVGVVDEQCRSGETGRLRIAVG